MSVISGGSLDEVRRKVAALSAESEEITKQADIEMDCAGISALSSEWVISGVPVATPSIGTLMILQLADCIFLSEKARDGVKLKDIIETLFILQKGKTLLKYFIEPKRITERLASAERIAEKNPAFFAEYMKAVGTGLHTEYDDQLSKFAFELPHFEITTAAQEIDKYLSLCISGFSASSDAQSQDEKKKTRHFVANADRILPFLGDSDPR